VPLHADLITISACHSAGAKIFAGEGLVEFSWAFLKSGARNVSAGLWDVNDRSTAEMMADLYKELGRGARPAEALRSAQLAMVRSKTVFRKPYYWGPFEVFQAGVE
jgi:CHAT domain-containing protein